MKVPRRLGVRGFVPVVVIAALALGACGGAGEGAAGGEESQGSVPAGVPSMEELYAGSGETPPDSSPPPAEGKEVWWISCSEAASGCSYPTEVARQAAETLGYDFHVADGQFNAGGAYSTTIRTAIAAGADAILLFGIPCSDAQQAAQEAREAGIVIMSTEGIDCTNAKGEPFPWVMQYSENAKTAEDFWLEYGRNSANYLIRQTGGNVKVVVSAGTESVLKLVNDGFMEVIKTCSGCEVLDEVPYGYADFVPNSPWVQGLRSSLTRHPDAEAVFIPYDAMMVAVGGVQAVQESGVKAQIFGGQGLPETLTMVRDGRLAAISSARSPGWAAYAALDNINRALNDEPTVPQGLSYTVIDKDHNLPSEGDAYPGPVDWQSAYEDIWAAAAG